MQKVVIDTNIIVSELIQRSYPYRIIFDFFVEDKFQLCVLNQVLSEYYEVLARPKFVKFKDFFVRAETLLADIETNARKYISTITVDLIADKDDNIFLELADECQADFIITGNTTDFTFALYKHTKIVTPKEYWEDYQPE